MANDNFYGYSNKKPELVLPNGNIDMAFEKVNPYEFRKGMDYELTKMGCRNLHSSTPEQREKATTTVLKNLNEMGGYYSGLISYETEYRGREKKPSFKKYMEGMADHGMKEVKDEFKNDKMEKVKLRESINKMIKEELNEIKIKFPPNVQRGIDFHKGYSSRTITTDELLGIIKDNQAALNMDPNLGGDMIQLAVKYGDKIPQAEVDKILGFLEENKTQNPNKMTKNELDQMIMEELEAYLREEEEIEVDVEDDAEGGESEDVLRKIYDMLKDMFEGEGEAEEVEDEMEDEGEEEAEEEGEEEEEAEEVEESIQLQERFQKLANIVRG